MIQFGRVGVAAIYARLVERRRRVAVAQMKVRIVIPVGRLREAIPCPSVRIDLLRRAVRSITPGGRVVGARATVLTPRSCVICVAPLGPFRTTKGSNVDVGVARPNLRPKDEDRHSTQLGAVLPRVVPSIIHRKPSIVTRRTRERPSELAVPWNR